MEPQQHFAFSMISSRDDLFYNRRAQDDAVFQLEIIARALITSAADDIVSFMLMRGLPSQ